MSPVYKLLIFVPLFILSSFLLFFLLFCFVPLFTQHLSKNGNMKISENVQRPRWFPCLFLCLSLLPSSLSSSPLSVTFNYIWARIHFRKCPKRWKFPYLFLCLSSLLCFFLLSLLALIFVFVVNHDLFFHCLLSLLIIITFLSCSSSL